MKKTICCSYISGHAYRARKIVIGHHFRWRKYFEISNERDIPNDISPIDWLALAIVRRISALEFITYSGIEGGKGGRGWIKYVRNSWFQVEVDLFGRSIFILASWCRRCALRTVTLTRENAYARFRRRANDVSCNKTEEVAEETTVTLDAVCTDVTRIWNLLLRQQLRVSALNARGTMENEIFLWRKRRSVLKQVFQHLFRCFHLKKSTETHSIWRNICLYIIYINIYFFS